MGRALRRQRLALRLARTLMLAQSADNSTRGKGTAPGERYVCLTSGCFAGSKKVTAFNRYKPPLCGKCGAPMVLKGGGTSS